MSRCPSRPCEPSETLQLCSSDAERNSWKHGFSQRRRDSPSLIITCQAEATCFQVWSTFFWWFSGEVKHFEHLIRLNLNSRLCPCGFINYVPFSGPLLSICCFPFCHQLVPHSVPNFSPVPLCTVSWGLGACSVLVRSFSPCKLVLEVRLFPSPALRCFGLLPTVCVRFFSSSCLSGLTRLRCVCVCVFVCLFACLLACLFVCLFVCVCVFVCLVGWFGWLVVCLFVGLLVCWFVCWFVCWLVCWLVWFVCLLVWFVCLFACLLVCLFVCVCVCCVCGVCVCNIWIDVNFCYTSISYIAGGLSLTHESTANEAPHGLGGYRDWSSRRTCRIFPFDGDMARG